MHFLSSLALYEVGVCTTILQTTGILLPIISIHQNKQTFHQEFYFKNKQGISSSLYLSKFKGYI